MATREEQEYSSQAPAGYIGNLLEQGIFPYAQTFLDQQFQNYGQADSSPFTYTGQRVADFDPREQYGMQMADQAIGSYRPYLGAQAGLLDEAAGVSRAGYGAGTGQIQQGLSAGRGLAGEGAGLTRNAFYDPSGRNLVAGAKYDESGRGLIEGARFTQPGLGDFRSAMPNFSEAQQLTRAGAPNLDLARLETAGARANYGGARGGLGRAERSGYGSTGSFDPSGVSRFYDPYEEDVVQQTLKDVREGLAQGDMGMRDQAVQGGAFGGARSRLRRGELASDTARGAAEAIGGIRSRGYEGARSAAQQAFESQQGRMAGLGSLQSQLAGQEAGFAGQQAQNALARGQQFGALSTTEAQNQLARGQQLGSLELQNAQSKLARGEALNQSEQMAVTNQMQRGQQLSALDQQKFGNQLQQGQQLSAIDQQRFGNQMQQGQQLGQFGQQQYGMGLGGGQGLAGLAGAQTGQLGQIGQGYAGMAQALPALQQQDVSSMMGMGGLGRGRQQSLMDLNYQNFTGQYNLPMQTLQNVGSLAAGLGPLAGGYGYAGATPVGNPNYAPTGGTTGTGITSLGGTNNPNIDWQNP
tara:strand:+ start:330 stop:2072 length:1743 start_codon:yes stop_codon:yes gene_type:complete